MIAVLGAGTWGTALAVVLARNYPQSKVLLWGRRSYTNRFPDLILPDNIEFTTDLVLAIRQATDLLIAVPSSAFSDLIQKIIPYIVSHRIVWATKGLDAKTNKFFSQIIKDLLGENVPIAMLSGPSFAKEVIAGLPTAVVIAFQDKETDQLFANDLIKRLHSKTFRVYVSHDLIGVQLGGVFKNILAVATGICDGLGFGANTRAALITRGLAEILRLADKLGAKSQTLMGLSGVGDIFLTCSDNQSRNRRFGMSLAGGSTIDQAKLQIGQAIEALDNIEALHKLAINYKVEMPIVESIWQILNKNIPLFQVVEDLLSREPQIEYV